MDCSISFMKTEIKDILENCKEKIFILVDEDIVEGLINATMGENIIWTMEIQKISKENKIDYIDKVLKRNNIKLSNFFADEAGISFTNSHNIFSYSRRHLIRNSIYPILFDFSIN